MTAQTFIFMMIILSVNMPKIVEIQNMMQRLVITALACLASLSVFSQQTYHSIDQNEIILQGYSSDYDFYQNTYYNAFEELSITWEIINVDIPNEWDFSICFPECYPIGTINGSNEFTTNSSNYLNCHVYPNNISGSGLIQMAINTDGLYLDTVSWIATANKAMMINENIYSKKLIKITDGLGQEVNQTTNQILFHIYDDGSVEKKFIVD